VEKSVLVLALGLTLAGCSKARASGPDAALPVVAAAAVERHPTAPPAQNPRDIKALFQNEAASRPSGTLRVEEVLSALGRTGVELSDQRQHLARPYAARYCMGAMAGADLALSVCEYIDAEAARAGAAVSRKIPLQNREIRVQGATSMTIRQLKKTAETDALSARLFAAFAAL
jgi:hypothetical protein